MVRHIMPWCRSPCVSACVYFSFKSEAINKRDENRVMSNVVKLQHISMFVCLLGRVSHHLFRRKKGTRSELAKVKTKLAKSRFEFRSRYKAFPPDCNTHSTPCWWTRAIRGVFSEVRPPLSLTSWLDNRWTTVEPRQQHLLLASVCVCVCVCACLRAWQAVCC